MYVCNTYISSKSNHFCFQWSVLLPVVSTLIANQVKDSEVAKRVANFCYTKWALEAFFIANAERFVVTNPHVHANLFRGTINIVTNSSVQSFLLYSVANRDADFILS